MKSQKTPPGLMGEQHMNLSDTEVNSCLWSAVAQTFSSDSSSQKALEKHLLHVLHQDV